MDWEHPGTADRTWRRPKSDEAWCAVPDGNRVRYLTDRAGKARTRTAEYADATAAREAVRKEEWSRLRKGFSLVREAARPGEALVHRYLASPYTGALIATHVGGRLLTNRSGETEELVLLGADGEIEAGIALPPETLVWEAVPVPELGRTLLLADHAVLAWGVGSVEFETVSPANRSPASFLSVAGTRVAFYREPEVVVRDLAAGRDLLRVPVEPELFHGHSPQMEGALSPDGATLALCIRSGELRIVNVASGEEPVRPGEFAMLHAMRFAPDGSRILALDRYGSWGTLAFDPATGVGVPAVPGREPGSVDEAFAFDPSGRRLAIVRRGRAFVYERSELRLEFAIEHAVKRAALAWIGESVLGARTDTGVASLYAVGG